MSLSLLELKTMNSAYYKSESLNRGRRFIGGGALSGEALFRVNTILIYFIFGIVLPVK